MIAYREFMSLTDEEIKEIMLDIFVTERVDNIQRDEKWGRITCDIYIMEEYPECADEIVMELPSVHSCGLSTHDFEIAHEEYWKWQQWLLSKGCDERLKDNPYISNALTSDELEQIRFALDYLHDADLSDLGDDNVRTLESAMEKLGIQFTSQL